MADPVRKDYSLLIVEDEDSVRLTLRDFLVKQGYRVFVASDGVGAIKQLLDERIDLVVTDFRMEIFGGDYWIRFLQHYCRGVKVIITSGFLSPDIHIPFPVLYKPYDYSELTAKIHEELG